MTQGPRETLRDVVEDEEPTAKDLPIITAPTYEQAPPTLEMRPSPFHGMASVTPTAPGMGAPVSFDATITEKPHVAIVPPVVVGTPDDMAGPTNPDGYPIPSSWDGAPAQPRPTDEVPPPDAPKIEISRSLEAEVPLAQALAASSAREPKPKPRPARRHTPQPGGPGPHAPTYQLLPALQRKKPEREGSDWPLMVGLLVLGLVIAGLVGGIAYGVVRSMSQREAPAEPAH